MTMEPDVQIDRWIDALEGFSKSVSDGSLMRSAVEDRAEAILDLQRAQLMEGKASDGGPLHPTYSEDTFFRSREAMERYRGWKHRLNPRRDMDAPDLFITGKFHSMFKLETGTDYVMITNTWDEVFDKYGAEQFGLTDENWETVLDDIRPAINTLLRSLI